MNSYHRSRPCSATIFAATASVASLLTRFGSICLLSGLFASVYAATLVGSVGDRRPPVAKPPLGSKPKPTAKPTRVPAKKKPEPQRPIVSYIQATFKTAKELYANLTGVRGRVRITTIGELGAPDKILKGDSLALFDLKTKEQTVLWNCTNCWSPSRIGPDSIAVLTTEGIVIGPASPGADRQPELKVRQTNLIVAMGEDPKNPGQLIVVQKAATGKTYQIMLADLEHGTVQATSGPALSDKDLQDFVRPEQLWNEKVLDCIGDQAGGLGSHWTIQIGRRLKLAKSGDESSFIFEPMDIKLDRDNNNRLYPIWKDVNSLIYIVSDPLKRRE